MRINITSMLTDDDLLLCKRISELYSRAEKSIPAASQFLNEREQYIIENRMSSIFSEDDSSPYCCFWGGYDDSERAMLFCLPAYVRYELNGNKAPKDLISEYIAALKIKSGGYVKLSHRDYLGAIIGLGIDRAAVGDILTDEDGAVVFVAPSVAQLMKSDLVYIGRDKVKVSDITLPDDFTYNRSFEELRSTVASPRLDAVISELAKTSRENAKGIISAGLAEHNYFTAVKPGAEVNKGDVISIRRVGGTKGGKFIIDSIDEKSSKGRIRLFARKYI